MSMGGQRPDVTDEDIGIRTFQLRKARAVERAMERLRQGLQSDWGELSHAEIEALGWVLGELWAYVSRDEWDDLHFSKLGISDVRAVIRNARAMANNTRNSVDVLQEVRALVLAKS